MVFDDHDKGKIVTMDITIFKEIPHIFLLQGNLSSELEGFTKQHGMLIKACILD